MSCADHYHRIKMLTIHLCIGFLLFLDVLCISFNVNRPGRRQRPRKVDENKTQVYLAVVTPFSNFEERGNRKVMLDTEKVLRELNYNDDFEVIPFLETMRPTPSPTETLELICNKFLGNRTAAVLYFTKSEDYGRNTVASQYFLELAKFIGIPVISWNADNSALEQGSIKHNVQLQLAPTIKHQALAIISLIKRYGWHSFSIITGQIGGHSNFVQGLRETVSVTKVLEHRMQILDVVMVKDPKVDLKEMERTESRIFLLYSTRKEAIGILAEAEQLGLTAANYVWIATQPVIGEKPEAPHEFPVGMLGVHFPTDIDSMRKEIGVAMKAFGHGLELIYRDSRLSMEQKISLVRSNVTCMDNGPVRWSGGFLLYKYLQRARVHSSKAYEHTVSFQKDGSSASVELKIVNLRPPSETSSSKSWEEIGHWKSETSNKIEIKDIVWPGNALKPPEGVPERRFLTITFLEEDPYIILSPPTACATGVRQAGAICQMVADDKLVGVNVTLEKTNPNSTLFQCCSGYCVDLLKKFSNDLSFDYNLKRVKDGKWGGIVNGKWDGLVAELVNHETDLVLTSLKINSARETAIDFSVPFLETGITILVSKRTGIISPTAFLEPFDMASWMLVILVAVQVAAGSIFLFEWLSPSGYNMCVAHPNGRFSFVRSLWLVWVVLFKAAVNVDCPQGYSARWMSNIWALFALIFLAIYTANLAAFMITREEYYNLNGVEDPRLQNPLMMKPPFRFGTIPNGATDFVMKKNFPEMHPYMKKFNRSTVKEGNKAVKKGELDAFIYDATVLEYLVGQDDECNTLTVGSWYAMTGYGIAFPKNSKWIPMFNEHLMGYRENGDLERLQRFWFTGACKPGETKRSSSKPLALAQFMSAFILLGCGVILSVLLLVIEHCYFKYIRKPMAAWNLFCCGGSSWCNLLSLSIGESLSLQDCPKDKCKSGRKDCHNELCSALLSNTEVELVKAQEHIRKLQDQIDKLDRISVPGDSCEGKFVARWKSSIKHQNGGGRRIEEIETVL